MTKIKLHVKWISLIPRLRVSEYKRFSISYQKKKKNELKVLLNLSQKKKENRQ